MTAEEFKVDSTVWMWVGKCIMQGTVASVGKDQLTAHIRLPYGVRMVAVGFDYASADRATLADRLLPEVEEDLKRKLAEVAPYQAAVDRLRAAQRGELA